MGLQPITYNLQPITSLFLIAGNGTYPFLIARGARAAGVSKIVVAAFEGETNPNLANEVDEMIWMRVGQVGKLLTAARKSGIAHGIMAGQIAPKNLFDLRPDLKALMLLATLKERNAESLFSTLARELDKMGVTLLPATTFLEESLVTSGWIAGPKLRKRDLETIQFGHHIAKEVSRLDIGQTVIVKNGTVLAVEGFEGTDETIKRGGMLGRGGRPLAELAAGNEEQGATARRGGVYKDILDNSSTDATQLFASAVELYKGSNACMVKVSKPNHDMRFDVPVIGTKTLETAAAAGINIIALEAGCTLLLEKEKLLPRAEALGITLWGVE